MNSLRTYRKFFNFNKLFDMFLMLMLVVITILVLGAIFYFTESYVLLFVICLFVYCISVFICKLFEVKIGL